MRIRAFPLAMAIFLAAPALAQAQPNEVQALADEQFREGRRQMEKGNFAQALKVLKVSQSLAPGRGKLLNIAICEHALGRTATALRLFEQVAADLPKDDERASMVEVSINTLRRQVPRLRILLDAEEVPNAQVTIDGEPIAPELLALAIPVDPGSHSLSVKGTKRSNVYHRVDAREGRETTLDLRSPPPAPEPEPAPAPAPAKPTKTVIYVVEPGASPAKSQAPAPASSRDWILGGVVGAVGLTGLGVGIGFAVDAKSKYEQTKSMCDTFNSTTYCTVEGRDLRADSRSSVRVSTVAFVLGGAASISSMLMLSHASSASSKGEQTTSLLVGPGSLAVVGRW